METVAPKKKKKKKKPYQIRVGEKPLAHTCAHTDILPPQRQLKEAIHLTWKLSFHLSGGNHSEEVKRQLINNKGDRAAAASTLGKKNSLLHSVNPNNVISYM